MAWTNPRTWTTGELVTDTMLNIHLRDNLNALRPHTTKGDIAKLDSSGQLARLPVGNETECLKTYGGDAVYKGAFGFLVTNSTSQSISNNNNTNLSFDTEDFDPYGFVSSDKATIPSGFGGLYLCGGTGSFDGHSSVNTLRRINLNSSKGGFRMDTVQGNIVEEVWLSVCGLFNLSAGDKIYLKVLQMSGTSLYFRDYRFWGFKVM